MHEVAPRLSGSTGIEQRNGVDKFNSSVKLDVKLYPTFDGSLGGWLKFKRGVLALASTHGLDDVFNKNFQVPAQDKGHDWDLYAAKNKFVYSMWTSRVFGSYPLTIIRSFEQKKDGRGVYLQFLDHYENTNNMEQVSLLALSKLQELSLTYKTPGGLPGYVTKFRDAILDLQEAGKPLDDTLQKSMFLSKIHDREYKHIIDSCIDDPKLSLEDCMNKMHSKYVRSNPHGNKVSTRKANYAASQDNNNGKKHKDYIPHDKWKAMSSEERKAILQKRSNKKKEQGRKDKTSSREKIPSSNYKKRNAKVVTALKTVIESLEGVEEESDAPCDSQKASSSDDDQQSVDSEPNLKAIMRSQVCHTASA